MIDDMPKTLAECADLLYTTREERLKKQKVVDDLAKKESALKAHLIESLPLIEASGVSGKVARVSLVVKKVPSVNDWSSLYNHILATKEFDLMQKTVSSTAVKQRWEDSIEVPGVVAFDVTSVSMNKL